tara:strand:+ start:763 stop:1389 length:627 start_codon:yes stop_codon:yes gene_type:complete
MAIEKARKFNNVRLGNFNESVNRRYPNVDYYKGWARSFLNSDLVKDYDAYLWGSFPERATNDIDILLVNPNIDDQASERMEEIFLANLNESLVKNNVLVDLTMSNTDPLDYKRVMNAYIKTKERIPSNAYVYGDIMYVDDKPFKDRTTGMLLDDDGTKGYVTDLGNNVFKMGGALPTQKMLNARDMGAFSLLYGGKPMKIKDSGSSYT